MGKTVTREEVNALILKLIEQEGSRAAAARKLGITRAYITNVLSGKDEPGKAILDYFDIEKVRTVTYKQK